ncbi:ribosomal protein S18 acetylase RimI-like enzyme [Flavobacterium sp. 28A]|uniref:GNAT family N-acetyltransferase n=1 Tax=Flavobacterium sp. 28A TaxID=2735895 RepID=UPI001570752E|nr:GNAT family N-acetyltransferase [Flavobacterium sp. 28A]NRT15923.1 ribosomal protein S18 acetylase RimI-like enzyme [Flavobacterium sp. 28A]
MIRITPATTNDFKTIQDIAYKTWPATYGAILSEEQLSYMLTNFYSEETLKDNLVNKGHHFILALEDDNCLGFTSFEHNYQNKNKTHIHKIYILPETQGKGIGKILLDAVELSGLEIGSDILSLNVNRYNTALGFYKKIGFEITEEVDITFGEGYLMEDYIMEKRL